MYGPVRVFKAVDAWVCAGDKVRTGGGSWSSDSISREGTHKQWANLLIDEEKEDGRQQDGPLLYVLGSQCRVGSSYWLNTCNVSVEQSWDHD